MAIDNEGVNIVITGDSSKAVQEIRKVEASVNGLLSLEVGKSLEATFGTVFKTITSTLQSVARAVSGVMKNALSIGGGFESQMTSVKVISGATAEELDALTKKAREMGATLPITAKDAATAMTLLAQRGNDANKILASVNAVSNLAVSQAVDMASAADILGSTITNFAMSVDDADRITAIFNNACNQSALSMSKLIEAMKYVGPAAGAVDMEITEAVSAMEAIANAGLTGEMTGTGLAMVLSKLAAKSHILGVDTKNLDGSMRDIADIFSELKQKGFSLADAIAAFGQRGSKAALALAKNSASLKANQERLKQWDSTQNAVNEKMKTFTNTLNAFRSASEELHIEIFEQIKNQAKDAVGSIADLTRQFSKWIGETQIAGKALDAFLKGLGFNIPSADSFQKLLNSFNVQSFLDSIQSFGSALKGIVDSIVSAFSMIKAPLLFLIEHLGTFATISFWGWILGKGLQVPVAIMGIVAALKQFYSAVVALDIIKWSTLTGYIKSFFAVISSPVEITAFLSASKWAALINPITAVAVLCSTLGYNIMAARAEVEKASNVLDDTIKRIQNEIKDADADLKLHIDFDIKTGFEKIPDSYFKASDELRASFDEINKAAQEDFKDQFAQALDWAIQKFPELVEEARNAGINLSKISNETYASVAKALNGDEDAYKNLPNILKKITGHVNQMNLALGKGNKTLIYTIAKFDNLERELDKMKPQNKVKTFYEDISANLRNIFANLPKQIEEANKFLNGSDGQLAINVSLETAKKELDAFVKSAADKFAIPEDIVKQSTINKLQELANQGNKTAQALIKAWGKADTSVEDFIDKAKEAISYLGASPQHFLPALNSMMKNIQKIDPVTGKLTEQFKKAHDALKELANVTFDKLNARIQKLRKAVEGGFIDQSALENEFKNSLPQIKLQVISELEPIKNQFASQYDYQSIVASEIVAKVQDLFGDIGTNLLRNLYDGMKGIDIGQSILRDLGLSGSQGYININGVEQSLNNAVNPLADMLNSFTPTVANARDALSSFNEGLRLNSNVLNNTSDSMISFINSIRTPADIFGNRSAGAAAEALSRNSGNVTSPFDYSAQFSNVIQHLHSINSNSAASVNALNSLGNSLHSLGPQSLNENNISAAVNNALSPLFERLLSAVSNNNSSNDALREISTRFDALKSSADNNLNALLSIENAVKSIEIKPVNENNIAAAVTNGLNPLNSRLEQAISAADNLSKNLISFPALFDALRSNIINHVNALTSLQNSFSSVSNNLNFSSALSPLIASVLKLDSALTSILTVQQNNSNSVLEVLTAVRSLDSALLSLSSGNTYNIDIQQQGFMIERKSDADSLARSTASAIRSGLGNGGV